jgi:hypothetical protein
MACPAKLFYDGKPEYANQKLEDPFLQALAEGGFQVGALAKCYFDGGYDIETLDYDEALKQTNALLQRDNVIIYEAAINFDNLFIRADILVKNRCKLELIEVKAKSFNPEKTEFLTEKGTIVSDWHEYIADAAFQKYVLSKAFPGYSIEAYLMLVDKSALCPTDGLNQKFKICKEKNGRTRISVSSDMTSEDLTPMILTKVNVDEYCELIYQKQFEVLSRSLSFSEYVNLLAEYYVQDKKLVSPPSTECKNCEFKTTPEDIKTGLKSGFYECWRECLGWADEDFAEPNVLDIWNFRNKQSLIDEGRIKISDLDETDINPKDDGKPGVSASQRQWLQVQKAKAEDETCWIDRENLEKEIDSWTYPLHFIDFETAMVPIPFNKGRHPYEGIAFQYSHHIVYEDGRVEHHGQYLNTTPGLFPNYEFIRSLKRELEQDEGSIFRYATHENTYLNFIYRQLVDDESDIPDRKVLMDFIRSITKSGSNQIEQWQGKRNMIDMCELVKRYYYDPATNGSNSIKQVLPAILNSSKFLQEKYSKPIYGAKDGVPSLNFKDWTWIVFEDGRVVDPYKLLPKMFQDVEDKDLLLLSIDDELKEGGAATTAYARMQFSEMTDYEREEITKALLKYCELDTLAMVMIYEGWRALIMEC